MTKNALLHCCDCGTPTRNGLQCIKCESKSQKPSRRESQEGVILAKWLLKRGLLHIHVPNGMRSSRVSVYAMKLQGLCPGAPDYLVWNGCGGGVGIELKAKTGRQSEAQKEFQARLENCGWDYVLAYSAEEAISALEALGY